VSIPTSFGEEYPKVVTNFLRATEDYNQAWLADPGGQNDVIAKAAGMSDVGNFLGGDVWFVFPTIDEQLGADWMGGNVASTMQTQLETFERLGQIESVNADFAGAIDTSYLEDAKG
jgi:taurine transport system substrate-binding protein